LVREYERLIAVILEDHISAANEYIQDADVRAALIRDMNKECSDLLEFRQAQEKFKLAIDSRSKDRVVSYGEKLSCRFMAALLRDRGVDSEYVDLSDVIHFRTSGRIDAAFYADLAEVLKQKVLACQGRVPVITGYFGAVPGGLMDGEVGRGYTDLCAALVAVGLKADELQVWKEVDGIFTADPNKVPTARLLSTITPAEAAELTFYGSEVIHHLTMDQVIHATPPIKIRIKNVKNPQGRGTIVLPDPVLSGQEIKRTRSSTLTNGASQRRTPKRPTAVTIKNDISVINVHSNKRSISHGFFAKVFSILDRLQISVDLISTSEVHVSMAVHAATQEDLDNAKKALEDCGEVSIIRKLSILSLVGAEMKSAIGIAGKMFSVLGKNNINLEMISQG
jgi:aspartate kinase